MSCAPSIKLNRTAVGLTRPSTNALSALDFLDGPVKPGHDKPSVLHAHGFLHTLEGGNPCVNNALACGKVDPCLRGDDAGAVNNYARRYHSLPLRIRPSHNYRDQK